jgi:Tfp pilus assembly protein PilF
MALWRTNQIEEAHIELQRAVEIDPENPHSKAALDAFQKSIE